MKTYYRANICTQMLTEALLITAKKWTLKKMAAIKEPVSVSTQWKVTQQQKGVNY